MVGSFVSRLLLVNILTLILSHRSQAFVPPGRRDGHCCLVWKVE